MKKIKIESLTLEEIVNKHELYDTEHILGIIEGLNNALKTCIQYDAKKWEKESINNAIMLFLDIIRLK